MNNGAVLLWHVDLDASAAPDAISWLDQEERRRADARRSPIDRKRFIAAHAALRSILGSILGITPDEVRFTSNEYRKPHLAPHLNADGWQFNMAHSAHRAIVGLSQRRRIGVDLEFLTQSYGDVSEIAQNFHASEREHLESLAPQDAAQAFYRCWTRKEAFLKALGIGILGRMDAFAVSIEPGAAKLLHVDPSLGSAADWRLAALDDPGECYAAAIAIEGTFTELVHHRYG